ncbi:hypothetical protein EON62_05115, partial [archaeon]
MGSGAFPLYSGVKSVALTKRIILVTINYRLGVLGFLAGDALRAESSDGSVGNYGFQDQRMALQFTRAIIGSFGGNPEQITIFGQSAGGGSTASHLVSRRSWGLFQRAIINSGAWAPWTAQPYNISATRLPQLARNLNCGGKSLLGLAHGGTGGSHLRASATSDAAMMACLRSKDANTVLNKQDGLTSAFLKWSPVIDGVELTDTPLRLMKAGAVAPVPILLGFNKDEGTGFNENPTSLNASQYL